MDSDNFFSETATIMFIHLFKMSGEFSKAFDASSPLSKSDLEMLSEIDEASASLIDQMDVEYAEHECKKFDPKLLEKYGLFT